MDSDLEDIWERTKKNIDVSRLKGKSKSEIISALESELNAQTKNRDQINILLKHGFAEKVVEKSFFKKEILVEPKPIGGISVPVPVLKLPSKLAVRKSKNKISIKKKGRFRVFNVNNVKITRFTRQGKKAIFFYNKRIKKPITWGLIN